MTLDTTIFHYRPAEPDRDQSRCPHCTRLVGFNRVASGNPAINRMADGLFSICTHCAGLSTMEHGNLREVEMRDFADLYDVPAAVDTICATITAIRRAQMIAAARWN